MPSRIMIAPPMRVPIRERPGRLAVCFILLGVHDLKDILREEQHEKTDQREKEYTDEHHCGYPLVNS